MAQTTAKPSFATADETTSWETMHDDTVKPYSLTYISVDEKANMNVKSKVKTTGKNIEG